MRTGTNSDDVGAFETALQEQKQRIVAALADSTPLDASPIVHDDENLDAREYETLVYEFHQVQLPELESDGLVVFDRKDDEVARGLRFEETRLPSDGTEC